MSESFVQTEGQIGQLAEERTRGDAFERVIAHFLRHDPGLGMRRVWTWPDWSGRLTAEIPATDLGIDLVAEDEQGLLVGVQVKFHRVAVQLELCRGRSGDRHPGSGT